MDAIYYTRPVRRQPVALGIEDPIIQQELHAPYVHPACPSCEAALAEAINNGTWENEAELLPLLNAPLLPATKIDSFDLYRHFHPLYSFNYSPYDTLFDPVALPGKRLRSGLRTGDVVLLRSILPGKTFQNIVVDPELLGPERTNGSAAGGRPGWYIRSYGNTSSGYKNYSGFIRIADHNKQVLENIVVLRKAFPGEDFNEAFGGEAGETEAYLGEGGDVAPPVPDLASRETIPAAETLYVTIDLGLRRECVRQRRVEEENSVRYECTEYLRYNVEPKTGIFIPANFTAERQVDLLIYLHGHKSGYVSHGRDLAIDNFWNAARMPKFAFRELLNDTGRNLILVAPTLGPLSQSGTLTTNAGFTQFVSQVLAALAQHSRLYSGQEAPTVRSIILAAHSGGGVPLRRIARLAGTNEFANLIRECWGFDCTYNGSDPSEWHQWATANPDKALYLFSIAGTMTAGIARQLQQRRPALPNVHVLPSRTGDHNSVPRWHLRERLTALSTLAESHGEGNGEGCGCECEDHLLPEAEFIENIFTEDVPPPIAVTEQPKQLQGVAFAPQPAAGSYWPLRTTHSAGRLVSYLTVNNRSIGRGGRRFLARRGNRDYNGSVSRYRGTKQNRWHVGIDLFAHPGDAVVACEAGRIINLQYFYKAQSGQRTYGILVEHAGCTVNYGEVTGDSLARNNLREGDTVIAGQIIGFVSDTGMLHFETYALRDDHVYHNLQWWMLTETPNPPSGLLNPTQYLLYLQENGLPLPGTAPTPQGRGPEELVEEPFYNLRVSQEGELSSAEMESVSPIAGSVGKGGQNNSSDVTTVQQLLNNAGIVIPVTGQVNDDEGDNTILAIYHYQKLKKLPHYDGRVDVNGSTLKALSVNAKPDKPKEEPIPKPGMGSLLSEGVWQLKDGPEIGIKSLYEKGTVYQRRRDNSSFAQAIDNMKRLYWGIDTVAEYAKILKTGPNLLKVTGFYPCFYGLYLPPFNRNTKEVARIIHETFKVSNGLTRVFFIDNRGAKASGTSFGEATGLADAQSACKRAQETVDAYIALMKNTALDLPKKLPIFRDVEPNFFVDTDYVKGWMAGLEGYSNPSPSSASPALEFIPGLYMSFDDKADPRRKGNKDIVDKGLAHPENLLLWAEHPNRKSLNETNIFDNGFAPKSPDKQPCGLWQFNNFDARFKGGDTWFWIDHDVAVQSYFDTFWEGDQKVYMA